jgi:hypothetical protein
MEGVVAFDEVSGRETSTLVGIEILHSLLNSGKQYFALGRKRLISRHFTRSTGG